MKPIVFILVLLGALLPLNALEPASFEIEKCELKHYESLLESLQSLGAVKGYHTEDLKDGWHKLYVTAPNAVINALIEIYEKSPVEGEHSTLRYRFELRRETNLHKLMNHLVGFRFINPNMAQFGRIYNQVSVPIELVLEVTAPESAHELLATVARLAKGYEIREYKLEKNEAMRAVEYAAALEKDGLIFIKVDKSSLPWQLQVSGPKSSLEQFDSFFADSEKDFYWQYMEIQSHLSSYLALKHKILTYEDQGMIKDLVVEGRVPQNFAFYAPAHIVYELKAIATFGDNKSQVISAQNAKYSKALVAEIERLALLGEIVYQILGVKANTQQTEYKVSAINKDVLLWLTEISLTGQAKKDMTLSCSQAEMPFVVEMLKHYIEQGSIEHNYNKSEGQYHLSFRGAGYVISRLRIIKKIQY